MRGKAQRDGRPAFRFMESFTVTRDMGPSTNVGLSLIQANATETAVQARRSPRQIVCEIKIRCRNFYAPAGIHHVEKFGVIPPTYPDDISQSTPSFIRLANF